MRQRAGIIVSLGLLALTPAACADGPVASPPIGGSGTDIVRVAAVTSTEAEAFNACVRAEGVTDFPGITVTDEGHLTLNATGSVHVFDDTYRKAVKACEHLLPAGVRIPGDPEPGDPEVPALGFHCTGTCPKTPEAPVPPK